MNDPVVFRPNARFVLAGEFGEVSLLAARMDLKLSEWMHLEVQGANGLVVFARLNDEETAALIVPGSGRRGN